MAYPLPPRPTIQPQCTLPGPYTVEAVGCPKIEGETIPRRHPSAAEKLVQEPEAGIATIYDVLKRSARKFSDAPALGSRKVLDTHHETTKVHNDQGELVDKKWTYYELSDYEYIPYKEVERRALKVGSGLRKLGLKAHDCVEIYAATSAFWFVTAHGAASQTITIITAYDTLGEIGLSESLTQTNAKAIFVDPALIPRVTKALHLAKDVATVVYNETAHQAIESKDLEALKKTHPNVTVMSFGEFLESASEPVEPVPPTADDLACIMYTSGSTGAPKGVLLKHRNITSAIAGLNAIVQDYIVPGERLIAYLPLAHIIEFAYENAALYWGAVMGYGHPRTLTDTSVRNCEGDIRAFKPSIMVGVPAVWESVRKGIMSKVGPPGTLKRRVFLSAMKMKASLLHWKLPGAAILDYLIFNKVREATGGNLRLTLYGGGAIAESTQRFLSFAICPMLGGYGLTETTGMGALQDPATWTSSAVGPMPACVEIKLVDEPDLGYLTSSSPPQGEVWVRGGAVIEGYHNNEEENAKAFQDGWFKTGDIGEFDPQGHIKIVDRKKNLIKTLHGEYIALEKVRKHGICETEGEV